MSGTSSQNGSEETPTVFSCSHHSGAHEFTGLRPYSTNRTRPKVGGGIKRVRHRVSTQNCYQGASVGRLHCGEVGRVKAGGT